MKTSTFILIATLSCSVLFNTTVYAKLPDLIPYRKGDLWGYCDSLRNIKIPCKYERAELFSEGLASVKLNGKWEFINKTGQQFTPYYIYT